MRCDPNNKGTRSRSKNIEIILYTSIFISRILIFFPIQRSKCFAVKQGALKSIDVVCCIDKVHQFCTLSVKQGVSKEIDVGF